MHIFGVFLLSMKTQLNKYPFISIGHLLPRVAGMPCCRNGLYNN